MSQPASFLFHDYETWGSTPSKDYPSQFAAIRTDESFNPIGEPLNIMCRIPNDYLPHPQACLVTGITPQMSLANGVTEAEFAAKIHAEMAVPNTCTMGYNSIRFDDEVSRHLFYRNFYDPYAREWQNGNSRWDIIDLARACHALRPEGIQWVYKDNGSPSFKLEDLTAANDIEHQGAHDALVDVHATIELTKLLKKAQPKLFDYALKLKHKQHVWEHIKLTPPKPLLHVSSKVPASQGCCTYILPIAVHPRYANAIICVDLSKNPDLLINLSAEEIKSRLYASKQALPNSEDRPGLKLIHVNKSPFVAPIKTLSAERASEINLNTESCLKHYQRLISQCHIVDKLVAIYDEDAAVEEQDAEQALYSGGWLNQDEKNWCNRVRNSLPEGLLNLAAQINNPRLQTLLFRYRARNFPHTLSHSETVRWQQHRHARIHDGSGCLGLQEFVNELEVLSIEHNQNPKNMQILSALVKYAQNL